MSEELIMKIDALATIITALKVAGAAEVLTTAPGAADIPDLTAAPQKADREIQVNNEASESSLTGHFHIKKTGITGGAGLVLRGINVLIKGVKA